MFELVPYYGAISSLMDFCYGPSFKFVFFVYGIVGNFNTARRRMDAVSPPSEAARGNIFIYETYDVR